MKNDLEERYALYSDDKLEEIVKKGQPIFTKEAIETANKELHNRGWDSDSLSELSTSVNDSTEFDENLYESKNNKKKGFFEFDYKPIIIAIIMLAINFYLANVAYIYQTTGSRPFGSIYISSMGFMHDIFFRAIAIGLIYFYADKQKSKYKVIWIILGLLFGAWALLIIGIYELFVDYEKEEYKNHETLV